MEQTSGVIDKYEFLTKLTSLPIIADSKTKQKYYNVPAAFDIEVTSFYMNENKCAIMYAWVLGINGFVTIGRTWDEFIDLYNLIVVMLDTKHIRLCIYVHNLPYEFQFIRKRFTWDNVFSLEKRKPVYARTTDGIEFRCSYRLTGKSLAKVGEDLQNSEIHKMTGDLDYDKKRHSKTILTKEELRYIEYDARVLMELISEKIKSDGGIHKIPYTKTGYVRNYCRAACFGKTKKQYTAYRALMDELTIEPNEYLQLKRAFTGGFTHANSYFVDKTLSDVKSYDFISSYPYCMLGFPFPMSKGEEYSIVDSDDLEEQMKNYCCLFDVAFFNIIQAENVFENPISVSRCEYVSGDEEYRLTVNNGRLVRAHIVTLTVTEHDYFVIRQFYRWEKCIVYNFRRYRKGLLPEPFAKSILKLYIDKTELKDVSGKEIDYALAKENLNSCYGMTVTDIVRDIIEYVNDEFSISTPDLQEAIAKYNSSKRRFLFYPWGVWVTSYARYNLFTGIASFGADYVYSDTDSIKAVNYKDHYDYIERYNNQVIGRLTRIAEYRRWEPNCFSPKNKKGQIKTLGTWNDEGVYDEFKTLGAKRYLTRKGDKYEITVAGLGKKEGMSYIKKAHPTDIFSFFTEGMNIPEGETGKLGLFYGDEPITGNLIDYSGVSCEFHEESYIHMEGIDYTLTFAPEFIAFLKGLSEHEY